MKCKEKAAEVANLGALPRLKIKACNILAFAWSSSS